MYLKVKMKCQHCSKLFIEKPIENCMYHFCNECVYLWMVSILSEISHFNNNSYVPPV